MPSTTPDHILIDANGVPMIAGTKTKVVEIALDRLAYHWDGDEIQRQHPHLTLGQIFAALSYYYDHEEEMNKDIEARLEKVDGIRKSTPPTRLRAKLKARGN